MFKIHDLKKANTEKENVVNIDRKLWPIVSV